MSETTNIYIDGELAGTIKNLQHDLPWHFGELVPGDAFDELVDSLNNAPYASGQEGVIELVANEDTVERVSWGAEVDTSEMIERLTLSRFGEDAPFELEFTCEEEEQEESNNDAA